MFVTSAPVWLSRSPQSPGASTVANSTAMALLQQAATVVDDVLDVEVEVDDEEVEEELDDVELLDVDEVEVLDVVVGWSDVEVDDVRLDLRDERVELDRSRRAGLEPLAHHHACRKPQRVRVRGRLADDERLLVVRREPVEDAEHPRVGPAAAGQAVGDVQDPHGRLTVCG